MTYAISIPKQFLELGEDIRYIRLKTGAASPEEKKHPLDSGWTRGTGGRLADDADLLSWINQGYNYGYHIVSGNVCIFDCDDTLYDPALISIFNETFTVKTGRGYHFIFRTDTEKMLSDAEKIVLDSPSGHIGHILLPGMKFQTVGPGCVHPGGGIYQVFRDIPIAYISPEIINQHIKPYVKITDEISSVSYSSIPKETMDYQKSILSEALDLRVEDIGYPTGNIRQKGLELQGVHPFHGSSRGAKGDNYCINPTKGVWHCFRHGSGGDAALLLAVKHGIITCDQAKPGALSDQDTYSRLLDIIRHGAEGADMASKLMEYESKQKEEYHKKKEKEHKDVNFSGILDGIRPKRETATHKETGSELPKEILSIPGVLQHIVNYYNETAAKPQPQIAVQTAIAIGAVILGRRFFTNEDNGANLYLSIVAKSAAGKEHAKTVIEKVLYASDNIKLIGPPGYTSAGGLATALIKQPNHIALVDEFGRMLDSANRAGNSNPMDAITGLIQVYGRQKGIYSPPGYSDIASIKKGKQDEVSLITQNPSITFFGITTPSTLFDGGLKRADISNGFLPRFITVESAYGRQVSRRRRNLQEAKIPDSAIDWCRFNSKCVDSGGNLVDIVCAEIPPEPVVIQISDGAYDLFEEYEEGFQKLQDANEHTGLDVMWGRCRENAQRLALIIAVSCNSSVVLPEHAAWAIYYVRFYSDRMIKLVGGNISDSTFEAAVKAVYLTIEKAGERGCTVAELAERCSKYKSSDTKMRSSILDAVVSDYGCGLAPPPENKRGVKRNAYVINKYLNKEQ